MGRSLLFSLAIVLCCLAAAMGAFLAGRAGGPDLAAAVRRGSLAGVRSGARVGSGMGRRAGYRAGYDAAYHAAYLDAYRRALKR